MRILFLTILLKKFTYFLNFIVFFLIIIFNFLLLDYQLLNLLFLSWLLYIL